MSAIKSGLIGTAAGIILTTTVFMALYFSGCGKSELIVKVKIPQINKITKVATICPEWKACYDSKINISTEILYNLLMITAADDCKNAYLGLEILRSPLARKNQIMPQLLLSVGYNSDAKKFDVMPGVMLNYSRMFGRAGVGFGAGFSRGLFINQTYGIVNIHGILQF